jgi:uncharacterized protein
MELREKLEELRTALGKQDSLMVAYSGGTDSAYLAYEAHRMLGERMLAVIADSPSLPRAELSAALEFAAQHGIPFHILQTRELDDPNYARNDGDRCFHCKDELFTQMEAARQKLGFAQIAYGRNLDDDGDLRPGQRAAAKHQALAPLAEAGLTKLDIRSLAHEAGLKVADKPASACLSSRIEYGRTVTAELLGQVERAEEAMHALGFLHVRVRHHGELARVEIARDDLPHALSMSMLDRITEALRPLGFVYVTLDTQGYRPGSMNDVLPVSAITSAH